MEQDIDLRWQSNIKALIEEHMKNNADGLATPWRITYDKLREVANAAARINDAELNLLMCELGLYTIGDQYHPDFNSKVVEQVRVKALAEIKKRREANG